MPASRRALAASGLVLLISAVLLAAGDKKTKPKNAAAASMDQPADCTLLAVAD